MQLAQLSSLLQPKGRKKREQASSWGGNLIVSLEAVGKNNRRQRDIRMIKRNR